MRAIWLSAVLASLPVFAGAQALPPPPYQTAGQDGLQRPAGFNAPLTVDRYGGFQRSAAPAFKSTASAASPSASGRYLGWGGKTEAQTAPANGMGATAGWSAMPTRWDQPPTAFQPREAPVQNPAWAAPQGGWRPVPVGKDTAPPQPAPPQAAPTSIYDPPSSSTAALQPQAPQTPQAPQYRMAQAQAPVNPNGGPRFYSLHREYGIQPDAIPLPPQFFGPTADLSAPVTDPLAKRTTVVNGQTHTVAVPDDQGTP